MNSILKCNALSLVALKYAVMMNGATKLIMMKSDVMNDFNAQLPNGYGADYDGEDLNACRQSTELNHLRTCTRSLSGLYNA